MDGGSIRAVHWSDPPAAAAMSRNLIHLFDFYLAAMFVVGTARRIGQYRAFAGIALSMPGRWPRLFKLVHEHRTVFLTWSTLVPSFLALLIWATHTLASRLIWHDANLTAAELFARWQGWAVVLPFAVAMVCLDGYFLVRVAQIDRGMLEKYFDQAEYWLRSWTAPVVRVVTFGYVNPRRMVHDEVRKALVGASGLINSSLYWVSLQMGLRVAVGLSLWLTWAVTPGA
jgi:hypothetical protein